MSIFFGHFDSLKSMIWGHHWIENSQKWRGFCESQGPAIDSQASFKILSATAVKLHFTRKSEEFLQCRSKFWNLLGNLSQALETRRTPPIFDYSLSNGGLKSLIWANQSDQNFLTWPTFFDRKNVIFIFDFSAFPGAPGGPRTKNSENYFYDQKIIIFTKKWDVNLGITSETTWGSRVKRPGNHDLVQLAIWCERCTP